MKFSQLLVASVAASTVSAAYAGDEEIKALYAREGADSEDPSTTTPSESTDNTDANGGSSSDGTHPEDGSSGTTDSNGEGSSEGSQDSDDSSNAEDQKPGSENTDADNSTSNGDNPSKPEDQEPGSDNTDSDNSTSNDGDSTKPEDQKPETDNTNPDNTDSNNSTSNDGDSTKPEDQKPEPDNTNPDNTDSDNSTSNDGDSTKPEDQKPEPDNTDPGNTDSTTPDAPVAVPTCNANLGDVAGTDAALLEVLFTDDVPGERATTFADWLVMYMSNLVGEVNEISAKALAESNLDFSTAFDTVNVAGILDLASAAPMYTCYLSSVFSDAIARPTAQVKRSVPTNEQLAELIALFERRQATDGRYFNYAQILSGETDNLISEVREVASAALTATDMSYTSLFSKLDVQQLLSIASEAPIYTSGLSAAFASALSEYSVSSTSPLSNQTIHLTSTAPPVTQMNYKTMVVNGTTTITSCPPESSSISRANVSATTVTICDETCVSLSSAAAAAERVVTVTSCDTYINGGITSVNTKYDVYTSCDIGCESLRSAATSAARTVTTTMTRKVQATTSSVGMIATKTRAIEAQTINGAGKKIEGFGIGLLGLLVFLL